MFRRQWKISKREECRKDRIPDFILGHMVNNHMTVIISDGVLSEVHGLYVFFGGGLTKGSPLSLKLYEILMEILIILKPLRGIAQQPVLTHNKEE